MTTSFRIGDKSYRLELPDNVKVLRMKGAEKIEQPSAALEQTLAHPIGTPAFDNLVDSKYRENPNGQVVIVISDNTRPVPYKGVQGILLPLVENLLAGGFTAENVIVLCANGTHTPLDDSVFRKMIDPRIFDLGVQVVNHDCLDTENLKPLGFTKKGTKILINRVYADAHFKILTGLVESHFMAGVSGGRKSICPGLVGEDSTFIFHSAEYMDDKGAEDLNLHGNPCHDEAIEVARSVGADFIVNVTLNQDFDVTGYFSGDMEEAHMAAVEKVTDSVVISESEKFDIVLTHAGFVGKNHYQAAKTATAAIPLLKKDSIFIMAGDCTDVDPVGKPTYRKVLGQLKNRDSDEFVRMIKSDDWEFVPDQWQVQMWAKLFRVIEQDQFIYFAPQIAEEDYSILPGEDGNQYLPEAHRFQPTADRISEFLESALRTVIEMLKEQGRTEIRIAWLSDGPYGIVKSSN